MVFKKPIFCNELSLMYKAEGDPKDFWAMIWLTVIRESSHHASAIKFSNARCLGFKMA